MRVLLITHTFPLWPGDSTAPFMAPIVEGLARRGHEIDVVLPFHPRFRYPEGEGIDFVQYRYSPDERFSWGFGSALKGSSDVSPQAALLLPGVVLSLRHRVSKLLATNSYDVVHAHWLVPNAWITAGPAEKQHVPLVVTLHGSDVAMAERTWLLRRLAKRTLLAAGAVTAVSQDLRSRVEALGADPAITRIVHLGVDTKKFVPREVDSSVRARLGAPPDALLVVAVGRLVEKKGFRYLIDAMARVEGAHLAIVGDGDLRMELETLARSHNANVTFTGNLEHSAVSDAIGSADVMAVPSVVDKRGNVDGLPTTLLEALSAGRPVVASDIAGIPEVISDRTTGLLVPPRDVGALVRSIEELRDMPNLRDQLGEAARRFAVTDLDWAATAAGFEGSYHDAKMRLQEFEGAAIGSNHG